MISFRSAASLVAAIVAVIVVAGSAFAAQPRFGMGDRAPTPEEEAAYRRDARRVIGVRPNRLAAERAGARRPSKRSPAESVATVVPIGGELVFEGSTAVPTEASVSSKSLPAAEGFGPLPVAVDNSTLQAFPPVRSQGGIGSCASFSTTYYLLTHMTALVRGWDAKSGGDAYRFSPKWTYNMINGGSDSGSSRSSAISLFYRHGACRWNEFPYDSNYRQWNLDGDEWRLAIRCRTAAYGTVYDLDTPDGLLVLKQLLANGYILCYGTGITSWQGVATVDNVSSTEDDSYVGETICRYADGYVGPHAMTVVGYNDDIWCDVNGNGAMEPEEVGALKIVNSWGTGWWNGGFGWVSYDALKSVSSVPDNGATWPKDPRRAVFTSAQWVVARESYEPELVAQFTVRHSLRKQMALSLGLADGTPDAPDSTWNPYALYYDGGAYAFDGSTSVCDGSFALDFTDLAPAANTQQRFFLGMRDSTSGPEAGEILAFDLVLADGTIVASAGDTPLVVDDGQFVYSRVDATWIQSSPATVTVTVVDDTAVEHASDTAAMRISRGALTAGDLPVRFDLAGTASHGKDYLLTVAGLPVGGAVVIPDGAASVDVEIVAVDDCIREDRESVELEIVHGPGYVVGSPETATAYIDGADALQIDLDTTEMFVSENGSGDFRVRLNGDPGSSVDVVVTKGSGDEDLTLASTPLTLAFDGATWDAWQAVTVAAADDADTFGSSAVFACAADGMATCELRVYELDDDQECLVLGETVLDVPEGATATCDVSLGTAPTIDVKVTVVILSGDGDLTISAGDELTFTPSDWDVPQPFTVAAAADPDGYEGTAQVQCSSSTYGSARLVAREVEDDAPSIGVLLTTASLNIMEGGTSQFGARLSGPPGGSVTIASSRVSGDTDIDVTDGAALAYDDTNWNTNQYVTLTSVQDADFASGEAVIEAVVSGVASASLVATEMDGDAPYLRLSTWQVHVLEGSTGTVGVGLSHEPPADLTVDVTYETGDPDLTVSSAASFVIAASDWDQWHPVQFAAADDADTEAGYAQFKFVIDGTNSYSFVQVYEIEDDILSIVPDALQVDVPEGDAVSLGVRLSCDPGAAVTVTATLGAGGPPGITIDSGASLTFDAATWSVPQYVVLAAADDVDTNDAYTSVLLEEASCDSLTVYVHVVDDDRPAIQVDTNDVYVPEGGSASVRVRLACAPPEAVDVVLNGSPYGDSDLEPGTPDTVTFDAGDWSAWKTLSVDAADDADAFNGWRRMDLYSAGAEQASVTFHEIDDDLLQIATDASAVIVPEGGSATFAVTLTADPGAAVTVDVAWSAGDADVAVAAGGSLAFDAATWSTPQQVTLSAAHDVDVADGSASIQLSASGLDDRVVAAVEDDDDVVAILTDAASLAVGEGGTALLGVRLSHRPSEAVVVEGALLAGDADLTVGSGLPMTFAPVAWDVWQYVALDAADDADAVDGAGTLRLGGAGPADVDVPLSEIDDDTLDIGVSAAAVAVPEGATASFDVTLTADPLASVTVTVAHESGDADVTVDAGTSLAFDSASWNLPQTVTLGAAQDADAVDGVAIVRCSAPSFADVDVVAAEVDDDTLSISTSASAVAVAEGGQGSFDVVLTADPLAPLVVTVAHVSGDADVTVSAGATLTFDSADWDVPQSVTLDAAADDDAADGAAVIRLSAAALPDVDVDATELDDDTLLIAASVTTLAVGEGAAGTFDVTLTAAPVGTLTVTSARLSGDADVDVSAGATLTFDAANWNIAQAVTLAAAADDDAVDDSAVIRISAPSLPDVDVTATEADDDTLEIVVASLSVTAPENGSATIAVTLGADPLGSVTVSAAHQSGDADVTVTGGATLTFGSGDWDVQQYVTVQAADDADLLGGTATVRLSAPSLADVDLTITEADDDSLPDEDGTAFSCAGGSGRARTGPVAPALLAACVMVILLGARRSAPRG